MGFNSAFKGISQRTCFKQNVSTARKSNSDISEVSLKGDAVATLELNGFYVTEGLTDVTL